MLEARLWESSEFYGRRSLPSSTSGAQNSARPLGQHPGIMPQHDRSALILTSFVLSLLRLIMTAIVTAVVVVIIEIVFAGFAAAADHDQINLLAIVVHTLDLHFNPIA